MYKGEINMAEFLEVLTKINKDNLVFNKKYRSDEVEKMKMPLFTPFLLEMIYCKKRDFI